MRSLCAPALAAAIALSGGTIQALPFGSDRTHGQLVVPVADKCGIGRYRGPDGVCHRKRLVSSFANF